MKVIWYKDLYQTEGKNDGQWTIESQFSPVEKIVNPTIVC